MAVAMETKPVEYGKDEAGALSPSPDSRFDDGKDSESENRRTGSSSTPEEDTTQEGPASHHHQVNNLSSLKRKRSGSFGAAQNPPQQLLPPLVNGVDPKPDREHALDSRPDSKHEGGSKISNVLGNDYNLTRNPRKRAFNKRVKTGCKTCRRRKKKCDEKHPECENCIKSGNPCEGYYPPPGQLVGGTTVPKPLECKKGVTEVIVHSPATPMTSTSNGHAYPPNTSRPKAAPQSNRQHHVAYATEDASNTPRNTRPSGGPFGQMHAWPPQQSPSVTYRTEHPTSLFNARRPVETSTTSSTQEMRSSASTNAPSTTLPSPQSMTQQTQPPSAASSQLCRTSRHISPPPPPPNYYNPASYHSRGPQYAQPQSWSTAPPPSGYSHTSPPPQPGVIPPPGPPPTTSSHHSRHSSTYDKPPHPSSHTSAPQPQAPPPSATSSRAPSIYDLTTPSTQPLPPVAAAAARPTGPESAKSLMLRSEPYNPLDPALVQERNRCAAACARYNDAISSISPFPPTTTPRECLAQIVDPARYYDARLYNPPPPTEKSGVPAATNTTIGSSNNSTNSTNSTTEKGLISYGVHIDPPFTCLYGYNLRLHDSCVINAGVTIDDSALVEIGARSLIGLGSVIQTSSPQMERINRKGSAGNRVARPVVIEAEVVVGVRCVIRGGVRLGRGCTVADGCVVARDVRAGEHFDGKGEMEEVVEALRREVRELKREVGRLRDGEGERERLRVKELVRELLVERERDNRP